MSNVINQSHINQSLAYSEYKRILQQLHSEGKTSGDDQSKELIEYSNMNIHRMNRLEKTTVLKQDLLDVLKNITKSYHWVVLSEAWCGDAAQILPVISKITELNSHLELHILFRDENPEVISDNLTNGTKSIPKLIILDDNLNKILTWGPRPKSLMSFVEEYKKKPNFVKEEMINEIQLWYNKDNTNEIQNDFIEILKKL